MAKILYDKSNKREADIQWFLDKEGNCWIDTDPNGMQMSGKVTIIRLKDNNPQYEVWEANTLNELEAALPLHNVSISDCSCGSDKTNESATGVRYCSNCGKDR